MIKIENTEIFGWDAAIRGMRNPMNSWEQSDSYWTYIENPETFNAAPFAFFLGENDRALAMRLAEAGTDHGKFLRFLNVQLDITAPLYWWKEYDTYKVGTVANSCSTMHKIHAKEFTEDDFSHEHLAPLMRDFLKTVIFNLNSYREFFLQDKEKSWWWQLIQLLPESYNQRRTVQLNYAVLRNIYRARRGHKLDEWQAFCRWIESLPYSELITGEAVAA